MARKSRGDALRVILMIGGLQRGGAESQLCLLAEGLNDGGHDVVVVALWDEGPHMDRLTSQGIAVLTPRLPKRSDGGFWFLWLPFSTLRLALVLRRLKPDVVQAYLPQSNLVGALVGKMIGTRVIVTGRRSLIQDNEKKLFWRTCKRVANGLTDVVIANADAVLIDTVRCEHIGTAELVVIKNAIHSAAFESVEPLPLLTERPLIAQVANLHRYKDHNTLLIGIGILRDLGIEVTVLLAGAGPEEASIAATAVNLNLDVRFLGQLQDVRPVLARADIVTLTSLEEGFSNALMEAMAAGKAIVSTDVGGCREVLGGAGILVPSRDPLALAKALHELLTDSTLRAELEIAARSSAGARFSRDRLVLEHIQVYESVLHRR